LLPQSFWQPALHFHFVCILYVCMYVCVAFERLAIYTLKLKNLSQNKDYNLLSLRKLKQKQLRKNFELALQNRFSILSHHHEWTPGLGDSCMPKSAPCISVLRSISSDLEKLETEQSVIVEATTTGICRPKPKGRTK